MKNLYKTSIFAVVLVAVYFISSSYMAAENKSYLTGQIENIHKNSSAELIAQKKQTATFPEFELFDFSEGDNAAAKKFSADAVILKLDRNRLSGLNSLAPENITLKFPVSSNESIELELSRVELFDKNFKIYCVLGKK